MEGKGPRFERETVITFNEEEAEAVIWTASETIYRRLIKRLDRVYLAEDGERHAVFKFPKEFINLPRLKAQKSLTPTQRAQLASRLSRSPQNVGEKGQSGVSVTKPETDNGPTGLGPPEKRWWWRCWMAWCYKNCGRRQRPEQNKGPGERLCSQCLERQKARWFDPHPHKESRSSGRSFRSDRRWRE